MDRSVCIIYWLFVIIFVAHFCSFVIMYTQIARPCWPNVGPTMVPLAYLGVGWTSLGQRWANAMQSTQSTGQRSAMCQRWSNATTGGPQHKKQSGVCEMVLVQKRHVTTWQVKPVPLCCKLRWRKSCFLEATHWTFFLPPSSPFYHQCSRVAYCVIMIMYCGINDRPTFATFTCHLIIAFLDELVCIGD